MDSCGRGATVIGSALAGLHGANVWHKGVVSAVGVALPDDVLGDEVASGGCLVVVDWSGKNGRGQRSQDGEDNDCEHHCNRYVVRRWSRSIW